MATVLYTGDLSSKLNAILFLTKLCRDLSTKKINKGVMELIKKERHIQVIKPKPLQQT